MSEAKTTRLAIGDEVRVHFHPPGAWNSFSEGVVRRVDVTTLAGRFFVLEVRNEILLGEGVGSVIEIAWPGHDPEQPRRDDKDGCQPSKEGKPKLF